MTRPPPPSPSCPCGRGLPYQDCCRPCVEEGQPAGDAEALMRSRYTAYTLGKEPYLLASWHPDTRPAALHLDATPRPQWLGLQVKRHVQEDPDHAVVEFVARYKIGGRAMRMHELSRFVRQDGRWYYLDGTQQG